MISCPFCGYEAAESMKFCPNCGAALNVNNNQQDYNADYQQNNYSQQGFNPQYQQYNYGQQYGYNQYGQNNYGNQYGGFENPEDVPSTGFNVLSFFFPLIGLILYLVWNDKKPRRAKAAGKAALIGFITGIVFNIVVYVLSALAGFTMFSYIY